MFNFKQLSIEQVRMKKSNWIFLVLFVILTIYYYLVSPESGSVMWNCPFKWITGLDCPSCGGQRAYHAFLHGDLEKAFSYNAFLFMSVPYLLMVFYSLMSGSRFARKLEKYVLNRYVFGTFMVLVVIWWVVRNL